MSRICLSTSIECLAAQTTERCAAGADTTTQDLRDDIVAPVMATCPIHVYLLLNCLQLSAAPAAGRSAARYPDRWLPGSGHSLPWSAAGLQGSQRFEAVVELAERGADVVLQLPRLVRRQLVMRRLGVEPAEPGLHPLFALEARRKRWYL